MEILPTNIEIAIQGGQAEEICDIKSEIARKEIAKQLLTDIDEWSINEFKDGHRRHLGASSIGKSCSRALWYEFHWAKEQGTTSKVMTEGQVYRLFNRGKREEAPIIAYLKGIGCKFEQDQDQDQIQFSHHEGHFGGSLDQTGFLPPKFKIDKRIFFEFKTMNLTYFAKVKKNGIQKEKPQYWAQVCTYGHGMNIDYVMFVCVNKNTDELWIELLKIDHAFGASMVDKAHDIITARMPPPKISLVKTAFVCKQCPFIDICHENEPIQDKNCRNCMFSEPADNKAWHCDKFGIIPDNVIPTGCEHHIGIDRL